MSGIEGLEIHMSVIAKHQTDMCQLHRDIRIYELQNKMKGAHAGHSEAYNSPPRER